MTSAPIADLHARKGEPDVHHAAARGMFERIAPTYDLLNRVLSAGTDRRWRARAVSEVEQAPVGPVLDLCAGTLDLAAAIADRRPRDRVVAVDFSPAMLAHGSRKAPRVETVVADAMHLPFEDGSFSAVVCGFGMRNLADLDRGAREVRRVLRSGGVFVTLEFFRPSRIAARAFHRVYARALLPAIGGLVSGDPSAYDYLARSMAGFVSRREYEAKLRASGFSLVEGFDLTLGVASIVRAEARGMKRKVVVGITGASGAPYARRLLEVLRPREDVELAVCVSQTAPQVWALECGGDLRESVGLPLWGVRDFTAPFASGSAKWQAMVIVPCSMGTVARIAHGISDTLLTRAADVMLKEKRSLVVVPRETPLSLIHLENLVTLARAGAVVLPAMPSFYAKPLSVQDAVDTVVARIVDHLGLENTLVPRWGTP